jgi:ribose-phosphate pyrophosphokinase
LGIKLHGDVTGKRVLIVDDLCDGGRTFIELAGVLRSRAAADIGLFVSHGLFTKDLDPMFDSGITLIATPTNTYRKNSAQ